MTTNVIPNLMYIFPGQGSQYVGMGGDIYQEFASVRALYERASETLGYDVAKLSFHGPKEHLDRTEFTQPALLTHSLACLEVFKELTNEQFPSVAMAGHSLGEYSALVAADALTFEDALRLVQQRGRLMSEYGRGRMAAFRLDLESVKSIAEGHYCGIGGCNLPDQTVVCGFKEDLDAVMDEVAKKFGKAKAGVHLNTEGAFHTYLMINAAERFRAHLDETHIQAPKLKVLSNYTGTYHSFDPAKIKASLFFQMFHPVKWMWGLKRAISDGVNTIVEFGGGIGRDKGDGAQNPAARRPNLEGITKKSQQSAGRNGIYLAAINSGSLRRTGKLLEALQYVITAPDEDNVVDSIRVDEKCYRLYFPVRDAITSVEALTSITRLLEMDLVPFVSTVAEACDHNIQILQYFCDTEISAPAPYLEVIVGGTYGAVLHYVGDDVVKELEELRVTIERHGDWLGKRSQHSGAICS